MRPTRNRLAARTARPPTTRFQVKIPAVSGVRSRSASRGSCAASEKPTAPSGSQRYEKVHAPMSTMTPIAQAMAARTTGLACVRPRPNVPVKRRIPRGLTRGGQSGYDLVRIARHSHGGPPDRKYGLFDPTASLLAVEARPAVAVRGDLEGDARCAVRSRPPNELIPQELARAAAPASGIGVQPMQVDAVSSLRRE